MIKLSFLNLFRRKTRTALALLGVMIGVASIIVLVSIVDGLFIEFNEVIGQFEGLIIMEKDAVDQPFSFLDESLGRDLEKIPGVNAAIPEVWYVPAKLGEEKNELTNFSFVQIYGVDVQKSRTANQSAFLFEVSEGRQLTGGDEGFVIISKRIADDYKKFVGSKIEIDDTKFIVKGIFSGESQFVDGLIAMNLSDAKKLSNIESGKVNSFTVDLIDPTKSEQVKAVIEFKYPDELQVFSAASISQTFDATLGQFRLIVFFVAGISAIVAGIGIANTILMSIRDRIKEIGTLKAVGWTNLDVVKMILFESILIGAIGGILGILFGFAIDVFLEQTFGLGYAITIPLLLQAFGFALFIGVAAGIYPAISAAKLEPVVALRGG